MRVTNPGALPKDPSTRRRRNIPKAQQAGVAEIIALPVIKPPAADPKWSPPIKDLWQVIDSKVPKQQTDLAFGWVVLDILDQALTHPNLNTGQVSASLVNGCLANLARIGVAHADRVRAGVILKSEQTTDTAKLAIMAGYREALLPKGDA
jgi:hypothetical protein